MGLILEASKKLQRLTNGLVVLIHHGGKDATKGLRGHSSLLAALDSAIEVSRNGESRFWRATKAKEAEDGRRRGFRLKSVVIGYDDENEPESSCVVEPDDSAVQEEKPLTPALAYALESLKTALGKCGADAVHLEEWRPVFYAGHPADKTDTKKKAFNRARAELLALKRISVTSDNYSVFQEGQAGHTGTVTGHVPAAHAHREPGQPGQHPLGCVPYVPMGDGGHGHA